MAATRLGVISGCIVRASLHIGSGVHPPGVWVVVYSVVVEVGSGAVWEKYDPAIWDRDEP